MDLLRFIPKNFVPLNEMMVRAGMSEMGIYNRTRDVFHHFHLPYDSEPPGGGSLTIRVPGLPWRRRG
jgi:hypothetical protein